MKWLETPGHLEKYRSFSVASLEICVSQSTLSQQIKKLEDELGVKLFVRYARSVNLTRAGEDFLAHARRIVSEIQYSRETVQRYTNLDKGNIKIGLVPYMAYLGLTQIIDNFVRSYPGFDIEIHAESTDDLLKGLREKKVNVAFINSPFCGDYEIEFYPLVNDDAVMLISTLNPLANESLVDLSDLSEEKFLLLKSNSWFLNAFLQACNDVGYEPKVILNSGHVEMIRSFAEQGIGVAVLGNRIAQSILNPNLRILPIRQKLDDQIGLAVPRYARLPLSTSAFRDFILKDHFSPLLFDRL